MKEKETEIKAMSLNEKQNKRAMERRWKTIRLEKKEEREWEQSKRREDDETENKNERDENS